MKAQERKKRDDVRLADKIEEITKKNGPIVEDSAAAHQLVIVLSNDGALLAAAVRLKFRKSAPPIDRTLLHEIVAKAEDKYSDKIGLDRHSDRFITTEREVKELEKQRPAGSKTGTRRYRPAP